MSKISTVYDTVRSALATLFPNKTEIPNPYSLADNNDRLLLDGVGLRVGNQVIGTLETLKDSIIIRDFSVIFTKHVMATADNPDPIIVETKNILEDSVIARLDLLDFDQMGIDLSVEKIDYLGSSGIEFINSGKFNIISLVNTFSFEISEEI